MGLNEAIQFALGDLGELAMRVDDEGVTRITERLRVALAIDDALLSGNAPLFETTEAYVEAASRKARLNDHICRMTGYEDAEVFMDGMRRLLAVDAGHSRAVPA